MKNVKNVIYFNDAMTPFTEKARKFAKLKHKEQKDDCGLDYFNAHLFPVAATVALHTKDEQVIAAAFLHDTLEDTQTTYEELVSAFGTRVADLVNEVTHDGSKEKGYYFPRLHSRDAIIIKFADRLNNMSRMEAWPEQRREHYLKRSKFWKSVPVEGVDLFIKACLVVLGEKKTGDIIRKFAQLIP